MMFRVLILILISYFLGSIPFSFILGKGIKKLDLRDHGSGNVGATNALRVLGWQIGVAVLLLDMLKGFIAIMIGAVLFPDVSLFIPALFVIIGHNYTLFLRFKGGKGVATSAGVFAALVPVPFLIAFLSFMLITAITKYVSVGSITAAVVLVISQTVATIRSDYQETGYLLLTILVASIIIIKHKGNIQRLLSGTENKLSFRTKK